jgi:hypothetical protein
MMAKASKHNDANLHRGRFELFVCGRDGSSRGRVRPSSVAGRESSLVSSRHDSIGGVWRRASGTAELGIIDSFTERLLVRYRFSATSVGLSKVQERAHGLVARARRSSLRSFARLLPASNPRERPDRGDFARDRHVPYVTARNGGGL